MNGQRGNFSMDPNYVDVASRIVEFRTKHPEGCLQPADPHSPFRIETIGDQTFIVVVAAAYRSPTDDHPGIGMAWEPFPGRTPYTKLSELQNAETSAWGRAIVAALAADTKQGVSSAEEVRNRSADQETRRPDRNLKEATDQKPVADSQARLKQAINYLLNAPNLEEAAKRLDWVTARPEAGVEIGKLIDDADAEKLGIVEGTYDGGPVDLLRLGQLMVDYTERHKDGPRVPQEKAA